nr:MAG TPA: hypothetical protein [Caudoviricetes sp.]
MHRQVLSHFAFTEIRLVLIERTAIHVFSDCHFQTSSFVN